MSVEAYCIELFMDEFVELTSKLVVMDSIYHAKSPKTFNHFEIKPRPKSDPPSVPWIMGHVKNELDGIIQRNPEMSGI
jgi:hypothetical protein